jgi:hypothetical protein
MVVLIAIADDIWLVYAPSGDPFSPPWTSVAAINDLRRL